MNFLTATVDVKVDDSRLAQQLARAKSLTLKMVRSIKASFKSMGASFKAVFAKMVRYAKWGSLAIAGALFFVTRAAMEQQDVIKRLEITLKATGNAAGFTARQLLKQAAALQKVTRFGDETITAMQTMLLTFKNIRGDEFKRATEAALDMATAEASVSGRAVDLTAVSIRLGKALNDPILGLTALARVGVDFTETQKSMIKEMVRVGNVAGAQQVILKELENQFGGMSRDVDTASGALKQMWNALSDVAEKIGDAFLPGITSMSKAITEWAIENEAKFGRWAEITVAYITYVKDVLWDFVKFLRADWPKGIQAGLNIALELFKGFGKSLVVLMKFAAAEAADAFGEVFGEKMTWIWARWKLWGSKEKADAAVKEYRRALIDGIVEAHVAGVLTPMKVMEREVAKVWKEVGASIKGAIPPELADSFTASLGNLKDKLEEIKKTAEELKQPMEEALIEPSKKMSKAQIDARQSLKDFATEAQDIWAGVANVIKSAFEDTSNALTDFILKGKADFSAIAQSILEDLTRVIVRAKLMQLVMGLGEFAGLIPSAVPSAQFGGEVTKTGLAVIHRGESFSGVGGESRGESKITINVNAIDAAGTFQFLNKNKRAFATMLQGSINSNHPLRKAKGWKS